MHRHTQQKQTSAIKSVITYSFQPYHHVKTSSHFTHNLPNLAIVQMVMELPQRANTNSNIANCKCHVFEIHMIMPDGKGKEPKSIVKTILRSSGVSWIVYMHHFIL